MTDDEQSPKWKQHLAIGPRRVCGPYPLRIFRNELVSRGGCLQRFQMVVERAQMITTQKTADHDAAMAALLASLPARRDAAVSAALTRWNEDAAKAPSDATKSRGGDRLLRPSPVKRMGRCLTTHGKQARVD